jgi:putative transposase
MGEIKRRRLGTDAWRALLARHAESGLSVKAFCEQESIGTASFYQWRSKLGAAEDGSAPAVPANESMQTAGFVDLGTLSAQASRLELRLDLGDGVTLHLSRG